jgi:holliday junction DNA helicase RuvA
MIVSVHGRLEALGSNWAVIDIGGIGLQVFLPSSTLVNLGAIGSDVKLYTHLHLREDMMALYGFSSAEELALFQSLLGVSGIGPKLALAMLSAMSADRLAMAITSGDADLLYGIPGIGKKTASRIILELKDKLHVTAGVTSSVSSSRGNNDVAAALTSLGYSLAEATRAVASLPPDAEMSLEEKLRLALQYFVSG